MKASDQHSAASIPSLLKGKAMSLPNTTTPTMIGQEIHLPITIPKPATKVDLPGYPDVPDLDSPTFKALARSIEDSGQMHPIHIDENDTVWDGRTRLAVMRHINLPTIKAVRINSADGRRIAREALKQRQWRPTEYAEYIYRLHHVDGIGKGGEPREMFKAISAWLENTLGWTIGFKSKNVQKYLAVGKRIYELKNYEPNSKDKLRELWNAESINKADNLRIDQMGGAKDDGRNSPVAKVKRGLSQAEGSLATISERDIIDNPAMALMMQRVYERLQQAVNMSGFADAVVKGKRDAEEQAMKEAAKQTSQTKDVTKTPVAATSPSIPEPTGVADALAAAQAAPSNTAKTEDETLTLANEASTLDA